MNKREILSNQLFPIKKSTNSGSNFLLSFSGFVFPSKANTVLRLKKDLSRMHKALIMDSLSKYDLNKRVSKNVGVW